MVYGIDGAPICVPLKYNRVVPVGLAVEKLVIDVVPILTRFGLTPNGPVS